jgi:hypothetical protein
MSFAGAPRRAFPDIGQGTSQLLMLDGGPVIRSALR